jgi:hypothetical protein
MGRDSAPVSGTGGPPFVPVGTPARGFGHLPHRTLLPLLLRGAGVDVCGGCGGVRATGDPGNTLTRLPVVGAYDRRSSRVMAMPGPIAPVDDDARHLLPCAPEHGTPSEQCDERGPLVVHCCLTAQEDDDQGNYWLHSSHRHYGNLLPVTSALRPRRPPPPPATANTAGAPTAASEAVLPLRSISPVDGVPFEPNALPCFRRTPYP